MLPLRCRMRGGRTGQRPRSAVAGCAAAGLFLVRAGGHLGPQQESQQEPQRTRDARTPRAPQPGRDAPSGALQKLLEPRSSALSEEVRVPVRLGAFGRRAENPTGPSSRRRPQRLAIAHQKYAASRRTGPGSRGCTPSGRGTSPARAGSDAPNPSAQYQPQRATGRSPAGGSSNPGGSSNRNRSETSSMRALSVTGICALPEAESRRPPSRSERQRIRGHARPRSATRSGARAPAPSRLSATSTEAPRRK